MMIHANNAAIANATMMRIRRLVRLTHTAHGVILDTCVGNNGQGATGNSARIGQHRLDMTRQCQAANGTIHNGHCDAQVVAARQ